MNQMIRSQKKDIRPTEPYPKILWYQIKSPQPTQEVLKTVYNRHFERLVEIITKKYPNATEKDINDYCEEEALKAADRECNTPTRLEKVVVQDMREFNKMKALIESDENFIQWYEQ